MVILDIWQKLQKWPRILKTLQNSPGQITEADPKLSAIVDQSLCELQNSSLVFADFLTILTPIWTQIEAQSLTQLPFDIN